MTNINIDFETCSCGKRGKIISQNKHVKDGVYCYHCYTNAVEKSFYRAKPKKLTDAQFRYVRLLGERQIAKFYGDPFNDEWIATAWSKIPEEERYF